MNARLEKEMRWLYLWYGLLSGIGASTLVMTCVYLFAPTRLTTAAPGQPDGRYFPTQPLDARAISLARSRISSGRL